MKQISAISNKLLKEFFKKKKETALLFIIANFIAIIVIPFLFAKKSVAFQLYSIEVFNLVLLRQWIAESFAAERENKTFESLISSGVNIKILFYCETGFYYSLIILMKYVLVMIFGGIYHLFNIGIELRVGDFLLMFFIDLSFKIYMAIRISWISLLSSTVNKANVKSSKYMILFSVFVYISINIKFNINKGLLMAYIAVLLFSFFLTAILCTRINKKISKNNIFEIE